MKKSEIAAALRETGLLLRAKGENAFKAKAYVTGARALDGSPDEIDDLIDSGRLTDLPGIGESLARYITEFQIHAETKLLNSLRAELPPGTAELSQIEGLTLKRIKMLSDELGVSSINELAEACKNGKVAPLKGFGLKTQNSILEAINSFSDNENGILLVHAIEIADELVAYLKATLKTKNVQVVGAVQRWHESITVISIVAQGAILAVEKAAKDFHGMASVSESKENETGESVIRGALTDGGSVEIFAVQNYALALVAHTGSDAHFRLLQKVAEGRGLELNALALTKNSAAIDVSDEKAVFKALHLNYIPPELREGGDEVALAEKSDFSDLIKIRDIQGMTHCHSTFSDGRHTIEQMALAAQNMGMKYITLTDHSPTAHYAGGLDIDRLKEQWEEIDRVQQKVEIKILKGTECDILSDGKLDYPDHILEKFDIIIASIHSRYRQDEEQMTKRLLTCLRNPHFKIWGHPLGRLVLRRDPIPCNVPKLLEAIADARVAIEINGDPYRLDLEPKWAKVAKKLGLKFVISTDAHAMSDFKNLKFGIHMARRAKILKADVLNTLPVLEFAGAVSVMR
jgi:DNA polymerase (family 10)